MDATKVNRRDQIRRGMSEARRWMHVRLWWLSFHTKAALLGWQIRRY